MNNKNIKKNNKFQKGFTLIETFIAITILLISISGPLFLVTKGLSVSKASKGQITAMYLAQEAIEYIRNERDANLLNNKSWLDGDISYCLNQKCKIDSPEQEITSCGVSGCDNLNYNQSSYLYGYTAGGEVSRFKREIEIKEVSPNKEVEIIVDMFWTDGPNSKTFTVKERLLNWQ